MVAVYITLEALMADRWLKIKLKKTEFEINEYGIWPKFLYWLQR